MQEVIWTLIFLLIAQQAYYGYVVNKLINKLMSRNYAEYEQSKPLKDKDLKLKLPQDVPEDLNYLGSFRP